VKWLDKKIDKFVPVLFQKLNTYENEAEDTRFLKVKIWLMHTNENLNGSYFDKSVVEEAIPTLANTPILAYIEDNSDGEVDFSDHRMVLVKEDGKFKIKYIGQAIGVIPENNNAKFEMRVGDDGVEREYLTVDGLVWSKWDDPIDIFNRDIMKSQSMELHDDYEGEWGEDSLFHFTKFSFFGACALGKDVLPAMVNSTIEAQFSYNDMFNEIQEKMEQFKHIYNLSNKGGNKTVNKKLELLAKYSLTEEDLKTKEIKLEDYSVEELETKLQEITTTSAEFSLTGEQFIDELRSELRAEKITDDWGWEYSKYSYVDYKDNEVYAYDRSDNYRLFGFSFEINGDKVVIDFESKKRKKFEVVDFDEGSTIEFTAIPQEILEYEIKVAEKKIEEKFMKENDELKQRFSTLEEEIKDLRDFKELKTTEERVQKETDLFNSFSAELTEDEMQPVKETASEFSLEQLEEKLFTLVGKKKATFSKQPKKEKQTIKINVEHNEEEPKAYGGIFEKYNN
jgi:hypothetical protein